MKKILILAAFVFSGFQIGNTQVEAVNYAVKYNSKTCLFDCYMVANRGQAKTTLERAQFNAQITIVAPVTSNVYVTESYMPLINNQNRDGNTPAEWSIANEIESPNDLSDSRLVSIIPELLPTAFYNDVKAGDEVKLFSFKVTPLENCGEGVRLYDNDEDPGSFRKGMLGSDFRNGFTIGGVEQKFERSIPTFRPESPVIEEVIFGMSNTISLDIITKVNEESVCQRSFNYEVYGPNGLIGDVKTFKAMNVKDITKGTYKVVATDNLGCKTEKSFFPFGEESISTSVNEIEITEFKSEIFPVPAQNEISITLNGKRGATVIGEIFDLEGRVVKSNVVNETLQGGETTISYETNLQPGMYNLSLTINGKDQVSHKLLIIK